MRVELTRASAHYPLKVACIPFHHYRRYVPVERDCKNRYYSGNTKIFSRINYYSYLCALSRDESDKVLFFNQKTDSQWLLKSDFSATERRISHSSTLLWLTLAHLATVVSSSRSAPRNHLDGGVAKGALTQEQADQKWNAWKAQRDAKIDAKKEGLVKDAKEAKKVALAAEKKVNADRAEAIAKKAEELAAAERKAAEEAAAAKAAEEVAEEAAPEAPAEA